jgi:hypothetical protein
MSKPYGCHNREIHPGYWAPQRVFTPEGRFWVTSIFIPHTMSKDCRYDHRPTDPRCEGCKHKVADTTPEGVSSATLTKEPPCPTPS